MGKHSCWIKNTRKHRLPTHAQWRSEKWRTPLNDTAWVWRRLRGLFSKPARFEPNTWFMSPSPTTGGEGNFFQDGWRLAAKATRQTSHCAGYTCFIDWRPGRQLLSRFSRLHAQVRICDGVLEFRPATLSLVSERTSFIRMETSQPLKIAVTNWNRTGIKNAE